jgi:hypothetical protein
MGIKYAELCEFMDQINLTKVKMKWRVLVSLQIL